VFRGEGQSVRQRWLKIAHKAGVCDSKAPLSTVSPGVGILAVTKLFLCGMGNSNGSALTE
jgi:hypothetical protein